MYAPREDAEMTDDDREDAASVVSAAAVDFIAARVARFKGVNHIGTAGLELAIWDWLMEHAVFEGEEDEQLN